MQELYFLLVPCNNKIEYNHKRHAPYLNTVYVLICTPEFNFRKRLDG